MGLIKMVIDEKTRKNLELFEKNLTHLINTHSIENLSNTPDFILSRYLMECLRNFNIATNDRSAWYKRDET